MGLLPEEFPVVLTVFLAMGAWRISKRNVLTRHMPAIETIGAATVLAVDKTGTLTENRMRLAVLESLSATRDLRESVGTLEPAIERVLATALAASELDAFDPMERAIHEAAAAHTPSTLERLEGLRLVPEVRVSMQRIGRHDHGRTRRQAIASHRVLCDHPAFNDPYGRI